MSEPEPMLVDAADAPVAPPARSGASAPRGATFPCGRCGADLAYAPGTTSLACAYCGHENEITGPPETIVEHDYRAMIARLQEAQPQDTVTEVKCGACGAITDRPAHLDAFRCAFCNADVIADEALDARVIRAESLLPFAIETGDAHRAYRTWIGKQWFAPSDLRRYSFAEGGLQGIYIPYWTYDAVTRTDYTGERGEHYWETETYSTIENGKRVTKTRQVRKTRWYPAAGRVGNSFDDILVPASASLPPKRVEALAPWDLPALVPYRQEYVAGFRVERYQVPLEDGFAKAREAIQRTIEATIRRDIGGDEQRIHQRDVHYDVITFKHILLPVYVSAYRYRDTVYRVLVNARTGEVQGDRPWSRWKIFFLVAGILGAILVIVAIAALFGG